MRDFSRKHNNQLEEFEVFVERVLGLLFINQLTIMANQADLDVAIQGLTDDIATQTQAIDAAAQAIIDKIGAAGVEVDLQPEIDKLNAAKTALDAVATQLPTTVTPPTDGNTPSV